MPALPDLTNARPPSSPQQQQQQQRDASSETTVEWLYLLEAVLSVLAQRSNVSDLQPTWLTHARCALQLINGILYRIRFAFSAQKSHLTKINPRTAIGCHAVSHAVSLAPWSSASQTYTSVSDRDNQPRHGHFFPHLAQASVGVYLKLGLRGAGGGGGFLCKEKTIIAPCWVRSVRLLSIHSFLFALPVFPIGGGASGRGTRPRDSI